MRLIFHRKLLKTGFSWASEQASNAFGLAVDFDTNQYNPKSMQPVRLIQGPFGKLNSICIGVFVSPSTYQSLIIGPDGNSAHWENKPLRFTRLKPPSPKGQQENEYNLDPEAIKWVSFVSPRCNRVRYKSIRRMAMIMAKKCIFNSNLKYDYRQYTRAECLQAWSVPKFRKAS